MNTTETLLSHNIRCLEQGLALLHGLGDVAYTHTQPPQYESGVGDHVRHTLEHYESFLDGLAAGTVDYDARRRDVRIATCRDHAARTIAALIERLRTMPAVDAALRVKMDAGGEEDAAWSASSVERELQYLQAHTIHHYALIAILLRLQGCAVDADFGVAPSTLRYRRQHALVYAGGNATGVSDA